MFFRKYKILGSSLIVAACISISFPSQASMTPMQNNYTLKGLSQHQQRETSAVIALKTDNDDNTFDKKETSKALKDFIFNDKLYTPSTNNMQSIIKEYDLKYGNKKR